MLRDERSAASIATLAVMAARRGDQLAWAGHQSMHTSNLPAGRCTWLRELIAETRVEWAISIDGDTTFEASDLLLALPSVTGGVAIGVAPVRIGGTGDLCNVNLHARDEITGPHGKRASFGNELARVMSERIPIASGGFGVAVFNLGWFRNHWALPVPERVSIDTGEDIEFCASVRERSGKILALPVRTDHFAWGERQTR
jgi:hypothetical protein